jgi:hypothetical protein
MIENAKPDFSRSRSNLELAKAYLAAHPDVYAFPTLNGKERRPSISDNLNLATNDPAELERMARDAAQRSRGLVMFAVAAKKSGRIPIDVDTGPGKVGAESFATLERTIGKLPATEKIFTPSGGFQLIYKGQHKFNNRGALGKNIDVPNYYMVPGQDRGDGRYRAAGLPEPVQCPPALQALVTPAQPERTRTFSGDAVPLDVFKKMLAATPYEGRHSYAECVNFLMQAHEACRGDTGDYLEAVINWCLDDPNPDWKEPPSREWVMERWDSFNADAKNGVTRASWFQLLKELGFGELVGEAGRAEADEAFRDAAANDNDPSGNRDDKESPTEPAKFPDPLSAADLLSGNWPKTQYIVDGLVMQGVPNTFNADGGTGKTIVSTQFGVAVAAGLPIFGRSTIQSPVLLMLSEDAEYITQKRIKAAAERLGVADPAALPLHTWCLLGYDVSLAKISDQGVIAKLAFYRALDERLTAIGPGCFVVLDSLVDVVQMDMNMPAPANAFFKRLLLSLCQKHRATILVLVHPSKASMADGSWSPGTLAMKNAVRNSIAMRKEKGKMYRTLWSLKHNYGGDDETRLYFDDPLFTNTKPTDSTNPQVQLEAAVLDYVIETIRANKVNVTRTNQGGGCTPRQIAADIGASLGREIEWQVVQRVMYAAERNGVLVYVRGYSNTPAHYELPDPSAAQPAPGDFDETF